MITQERWKLEMGANLLSEGGVHFSVWAPKANEVALKILGELPQIELMSQDDGVFSLTLPHIKAGQDYLYVIDGKKELPDPVSRWQPHGVHGPSRVVDPKAFHWQDQSWQGVDLKKTVIYELHVGTFTPEGTFESAIEKLPYLRDLGVTAIELMPIAQFPGERNWGYDGVYPFAPQSSYGGPHGLKQLINACHSEGLAVILDVVYNHLGPEGNYIAEYAPYFTDRYRTPWGEAINYDAPDCDRVRQYFIDHALYWLTEYHIDALRLDAIHFIFDFSPHHFLAELQEQFEKQARFLQRKAWITAESDLNDVRVIRSRSEGGYGINAQWSDDFHHTLQALLLKRKDSYFGDFGQLKDLAQAITSGFVNDGRFSSFRKRSHGTVSEEYPGEQFIICTQNHDQIGNACLGKRSGELLSLDQQKLATALLLFSPNVPLIFMGQEWGETAPFFYFTHHENPDLIENVRKGFQIESGCFTFCGKAVDPQDSKSFETSKLDWEKLSQSSHQKLFAFYRDLLTLRCEIPCLSNCRKDLTTVEFSEEEKWLSIVREDDQSSLKALLVCNFNEVRQSIALPNQEKWELILDSQDPKYGGRGAISRSDSEVSLEGWSVFLYLVKNGGVEL